MKPTESSYVRSPDGTKIAYEWTERESADTTAVFIHGFAESQAAWLDVHSRWAHSCSVLTVDLRGHGDSGISRSGVYSVSEYVEDVLAAVKAMGGKKQVFIGHSLGGWVASTLAAQSQQSTVGLLLVDISPESTERSQATIFGGLRERMRPYSTEADYEDHLRATRPLVSQKNLEYLTRRSLKREGDHYLLKLDPCLLQQSGVGTGSNISELCSLLRRVACPTLIVRGAASAFLSASAAEQLVAACAAGNTIAIPRAGHGVMADNPVAFRKTLTAFLDALGLRQ